jgi:hypothetical protein
MGAMPEIRLTIVRAADPPPWADVTEIRYVHDAGWQAAVLEHGMESGRPSVAVRIDHGDGPPVVFETSLAAWIAATAGMRGAFPAAFAGGSLSAGDARAEAAAQASTGLVRSILEALCERDGLPLDSAADPGTPARNYELADRLRIGRVFGTGPASGPRVRHECEHQASNFTPCPVCGT